MAFRGALACSIFSAATAVVPPIVLEDTSAVVFADTTTCAAGGHGGSFQHNGGALKDDVMTFVEYHFDPEESGCYLVEEYHPTASEDCAGFAPQSVPVKINFCKNLTTMGYINQGINGGTWNKLTTLPFYKGWPASIEITRKGLNGQMTACGANGCFWMADAFRLTYVAEDCRDPAVREVMQQDDHTSVAGSEAVHLDSVTAERAQTETTRDASAVAPASQITTTLASEEMLENLAHASVEPDEPTSDAEKPRMVMEAVLTNAKIVEDDAYFVFQPPVDGCYLIEEMHPLVPGLEASPLTINYCKGMTAVGAINHTDRSHDTWNYVANLPFYAGSDGRITIPKRVVLADTSESLAFRLTHVGARCHVGEAATHHFTVRITADFSHVVDRLYTFGMDLWHIIAEAGGALTERVYMTDLRSGSIIAKFTVRPAAAVHGFEEAVGKGTSATIASKIQESVSTPEFTSRICDLVDTSLNDCGVSVIASSVARPQVEIVRPQLEEASMQKTEFIEEAENWRDHIGVIIGSGVGALVVCVGLSALCIYRRRKAVRAQEDKKVSVDAEKGSAETANCDCTAKIDAGSPEIQKDGEKDGHSDDASTVTPTEQRDEGLMAVPGDADSGDGSQSPPTIAQV